MTADLELASRLGRQSRLEDLVGEGGRHPGAEPVRRLGLGAGSCSDHPICAGVLVGYHLLLLPIV